MRPIRRRLQRGASLIEALIGFLVLSVGLLASTRWQLQLRHAADLARQQAEALRWAQQEMEQLRAYTHIGQFPPAATPPGAGSGLSFESIGAASVDLPATAAGNNTHYRLVRQLRGGAGAGATLKAVTITLDWQDTQGQARQLSLDSIISRQAPGLALRLAEAPSSLGAIPVQARHLAIPAEAADLGDGRSAFRPLSSGDPVWVFDNRSGQVLSQCEGPSLPLGSRQLTASQLSNCRAGAALLLSGRVRFDLRAPPAQPDASTARDPPQPLNLGLVLSSTGHSQAPTCLGEAVRLVDIGPPGQPRVITVASAATPASEGLTGWTELGDLHWRYHCAVPPAPPVQDSTGPSARPHWSGQLRFSPDGWTLGTVPGALRLCRYSADTDHSGDIDQAAENPLQQTAVHQALPEQNFLAIDGRQACPASAASAEAAGRRPWSDRNPATVPHQP